MRSRAAMVRQLKYFKNGPLKSEKYFAKSFADTYPNAILRIWEAFNKNSQIRPFVLASADYNYVFGNKALRLLTDIKGFASTHGALSKEDSWGIIVSTSRVFPPIRPQDFGHFLNVKPLSLKAE